MIQTLEQLPLAVRIPTLADAVTACRARVAQDQAEADEFLDMLAKAEAEVTGGAPGGEGVPLSGLIPAGENPYDPPPPA